MLKNSEFPEITLHALCEFDDLTTTSNSTSSSISNSASKEGAYFSGGMLNFLEVHQYKSKYIFRESRCPCYRYNSFSPCIALTHHLQLHLHVPQKKKEKGRKISTTRGLHWREPSLRQLEMAGPRLWPQLWLWPKGRVWMLMIKLFTDYFSLFLISEHPNAVLRQLTGVG